MTTCGTVTVEGPSAEGPVTVGTCNPNKTSAAADETVSLDPLIFNDGDVECTAVTLALSINGIVARTTSRTGLALSGGGSTHVQPIEFTPQEFGYGEGDTLNIDVSVSNASFASTSGARGGERYRHNSASSQGRRKSTASRLVGR